MKTILSTLALAGLLVCGSQAGAQANGPPTIELSAGAPFKHRHSGVELPARLAGFARTKALELEGDQLDTLLEYEAPDQSAAYTVYIYRHVAGGLPVWFDRARAMIERRDALGTATLVKEAAFVPPGRDAAAGLLATYALSGTAYRSSGVALVPVGEWLVKLRVTSSSLSPDALESSMKSALAEIGWPARMAPAPAAVPVAACATPLSLTKNARAAPKDGDSTGEMLMGSLLGMAAAGEDKPEQPKPAPAIRWCRDSAEVPNAGVYRADEQTDGYLIALSDAGRAVSAGRSDARMLLEALIGEKKGRTRDRGPKRYIVQLLLLSQTMRSGALDRLPPPAQAFAIAKEGRFVSSFGTWGEARNQVTISNDSLD